jgi:two-component system sensor histidine kinase KdpD
VALLRRIDLTPARFRRFPVGSYVAAVVLVGLAIGAAFIFNRLPHANLSLLFLMVVLIIAARWGLWPSIFASVLSFFSLNFFFTQPFYTFAVEEEGDFATLLFFLAMATLTGNLAARMRSEMAANRAALERVTGLLDFSSRMAAARGADEALQALVDRLSKACQTRAVVVAVDRDGRQRLAATAGSDPVRETEWSDWQRELATRGESLAGSTSRIPGWRFFSLGTSGNKTGFVGIELAEIEYGQTMLIEALCDQASVATERASLVDSLREAQLTTETERLRSALLSSVSHDLRTPLASIIGSTTSLLEYRSLLSLEDRQELLRTVLDEAQRLNRYIQNLLDMTRFGQQPFNLNRQWVDINDLISSAIERLGSTLDGIRLGINVAADAEFLKVQGALIEQVFVNLLDNAANFAPEGSEIGIDVFPGSDEVVIEISNEGPEIPEEDRERIFDMFYRATLGDRKRAGTGLGLAICRSIVTAHGGEMTATTRADGTGALLRIALPADVNPRGGPQS